jgi:release factor glutamine methyltransferase
VGSADRRATITVGDALLEAAALLRDSVVTGSANDEARGLLCALLEQPRSWAALHRHDRLDDEPRARLLAAAAKRASGAPLAYAVGCAAFRHLTLDVDERVLIPRPETEMLVDLVLERVGAGGVAVDVGTGSGCIALSLAAEGKFDRVIATDLSLDALAVARNNVARCAVSLRTAVDLRHGSLLDPVRMERVRAVVSNPPYIAGDEAMTLPKEVRDWEPPLALYSSGEGMTATRALVRQAPDVLEDGGLLAIEVDSRRASLAVECAAADGRYEDIVVKLDLTGRERFVLARRVSRDAQSA